MAQLYAKKTSDGLPKALECTDEGLLKVDTELTATIDPAGLATEATLADLLAKIIAAPSTEAKQDLILTALGLIATEATAGDIKTATEALAALISAGALAVSLAELPDTAAGDMADINTASASIDGKLPAIGQQLKAASISVAPASDIADATYIGDVKFGEELPAGTQLMGKVGIDQTTPGTTNLVNVNGGASQTADIKVTLDSESVTVTGIAPATVTGTCADAYATALSLACSGIRNKTIVVVNTDAALTMKYRIRGFAKSGSSYYNEIQAEATLAASTSQPHVIENSYDVITVEVIDGTGHATYAIDYCGGQ